MTNCHIFCILLEKKTGENMEKDREVEAKIRTCIENLRPFLNMEGGDVEFIKYDDDEKTVYVKLAGACAMCVAQDETLELGLLEAIRDEVPEVAKIINVPL